MGIYKSKTDLSHLRKNYDGCGFHASIREYRGAYGIKRGLWRLWRLFDPLMRESFAPADAGALGGRLKGGHDKLGVLAGTAEARGDFRRASAGQTVLDFA